MCNFHLNSETRCVAVSQTDLPAGTLCAGTESALAIKAGFVSLHGIRQNHSRNFSRSTYLHIR